MCSQDQKGENFLVIASELKELMGKVWVKLELTSV